MMDQAPQGAAPAPEQDGGSATQLVIDIKDKLGKLSELLMTSKAVTDADKQDFQGILAAYDTFVTENLGQQAGADKPKPQPMQSPNPIPFHQKA